jgi:exopolysaccharide biosynthesis polyprenyl glycosylphosphotransferase
MLRQFSARRILGFLILDWPGTLVMLFFAAELRTQWMRLPDPFVALLAALRIPYAASTVTPDPASIVLPEVALLVALIWPVFLLLFKVYDGRRNTTLGMELRNVTLAVLTAAATLAGLLYFSYRETSRVFLLVFIALDLALLLGSRLLWYAYRRSQNGQQQISRRNVLVVGAGQVGQEASAQLRQYGWANLRLVGYADDDPAKQGRVIDGLPVLGNLDELAAITRQQQVEDVVIALPLRAHERMVAVSRAMQKLGRRVYVIPDLFMLAFPNASLDGFGGIPVIDLGQPSLHGGQRLVKRTFDIVTASVGLVLLSPLLLVTALAIKLESPGPVIYRQERVGENGRVFTLLKFRSMRAGADTKVHREYVTRLIEENLSVQDLATSNQGTLKLAGDSRITRIGKFLRKTSIDELPQFWNVLRGEMSLVGPRPPLPYEVAVYKEWHKRRLEAIPGVTGLWQVKGRNQVSFDEMVRMDLEYIARQSLWLDIKILALTPWQLVAGRGAG